MPSLFPDFSSLGFFYSTFILHQFLVPLQPPETWQKQHTLSSLPPTQKNLRHHMNPVACPPQLFFSSASITAVAPTPGLCVCLSTGSQAGTERRHSTRRKEHADSKAASNSISHSSLKASHSHPKPGTLLTCFPIWGGCFYNQNTTTLPTNVQRTNTTWAYVCL